jgi:glycosyltransferase involved in cell wall biosynthesis
MDRGRLDQNRIALMIPSLVGGGAERSYLNLANGFHQAGYQVDLILKQAIGEYLSQVPRGINLVDLKASRMARTLPGLIRYLQTRRPRVLIAGLELTHMIALIAQAVSGVSTKVIVTLNSVISQEGHFYLPTRSIWVQKFAIEEEGISPEKIVVIPNRHASRSPAQPTDGTRVRYRKEIGLDDGGILVLSVGRLAEQKGHIYLLEAIPAIVEQFPETVFAIAGEGSQRAELEARSEQLGISQSVRFLGTRSDIPELLQMADIFVLPSLWEGFPIALLEAMEAGLPVIATRVEGVEEIIVDGSNGLLLPPGDPKALQFALQRMLAQPDLRVNLGAAGKTLVKGTFRLDQMGRRYEGLFLQLLERDQ